MKTSGAVTPMTFRAPVYKVTAVNKPFRDSGYAMPFRFVLALAVVGWAVWTPSDAKGQLSDRKALLAQQRQQYRESVLQYPLLKQQKIEEVFRFRVDGASLALEPALEPDHDYTQRRAVLDGLSEPAVILCWLLSQDLGQVQFELNVDNYSDSLTTGRLHVLARPNSSDTRKELETIEILKEWQSPTGSKRVFFTQVNSTVNLRIDANDDSAEGMLNINLTEKDFATLRRNHPAETERYLRPIMRELKQEAAFAAEPAAAWQVLAEDWPVDEKLRAAVVDQLKALDDDNFHVRRRASEALAKLGRDGAVVMMKMDRRGLSLEQNVRLDEVIARFKPLPADEAQRLSHDPNFLLDCLYGDDPVACRLALNRLRELSSKPIELDLSVSDDARIDAVNRLRANLFPPASPTTRP